MDPLKILLNRHALSKKVIVSESGSVHRMIRRIQLAELEAAILEFASKMQRLNEVPNDFGRIDPEDEIVMGIRDMISESR